MSYKSTQRQFNDKQRGVKNETHTHEKRPYHAHCVQYHGINTDDNAQEVIDILTDKDTYATRYGNGALLVRFSKPLPGRRSIETLVAGWWVVVGENGVVKCYDDNTFRLKYQELK